MFNEILRSLRAYVFTVTCIVFCSEVGKGNISNIGLTIKNTACKQVFSFQVSFITPFLFILIRQINDDDDDDDDDNSMG